MVTLSAQDELLLPVLPLVYVAWADGELTHDEIRAIRSAAGDAIPAAALDHWLDPERPPSAAALRSILLRTREAVARAESRPADLVDAGLALARSQGAPGDWDSDAGRETLRGMHQAAGVFGRTGLGEFLSPLPAPEAVDQEVPWSVLALSEIVDGNFRDQRLALRQWLASQSLPPTEIPSSEYRERVLGQLRDLASRGIGRLAVEGDLGGFVASLETLGFYDLNVFVKCGVQFGLFGGSILNLGTERHHKEYLSAAASVDLPGCFAMTELGHGSNVRDLETVARFDSTRDGFVLHSPTDASRKEWIGNAAVHGRMATVFAQLEIGDDRFGVHALLVPIRDDAGNPMPGVDIRDSGHKLGLNGIDNGQLKFDHVFVPRENLLDRFASVSAEGHYESAIASPTKRFFTMLGTLVGGRVGVSAVSVSVAKTALAVALRYADRRRQFGPEGAEEVRLIDYPVHRRRLVPRLATTYALNFAAHDLIDLYVAGEADRELETLAAGLKSYASWHATDTVQECREACGGQGYRAENRFAALKADSDIFTTFEGDNTVLMQLVTRGVLSEMKSQFADMRWYDTARWVSQRALDSVSERNPITVRWTDPAHLRDLEFHRQALQARQDSLTLSLGQRLRRRLKEGMDPFFAFGEVQTHALALAHAYVERHVHACFSARVEAASGSLRDMLQELCALYGLSLLEKDRAWFLENGFFEASKSRAIREQVDALCTSLAPQALALVDAFDIPESCIAAPIASR
ncbi:MAG: acyl-CoA dehydrogenase [Myxococcota bacterium]